MLAKNQTLIILTVFIFLILSISASEEAAVKDKYSIPIIQTDSGSVISYMGDVYSVVKIGTQFWMADNFRAKYAADGSVLEGVYYYDNNENYATEYGMLYTWNAAKNACPEGWHLPSLTEWNDLISFVGDNSFDNLIFGGSSGFNAKFGGFKTGSNFEYLGKLGLFWTSSIDNPDHAFQKLFIKNESVIVSDQIPRVDALSVRYIKDY